MTDNIAQSGVVMMKQDTKVLLADTFRKIPRGDVEPGSLREVGFFKSGPAAVGFLDWVLSQVTQDQVDHILFVSPVGHVLKTIADLRGCAETSALPPYSRMLGSRVAMNLASLSWARFDPSFLLSDAEGLSPVDVLERIGAPVPADHILEDIDLGQNSVITGETLERLERFIWAWRWEILKICQRNKRGLFRHLLNLGIRAGQRVAVVDIGWGGEAQEALEVAMHDVMPLETVGYYFCLADNSSPNSQKQKMEMKALVDSNRVPSNLLQGILDSRPVCEFLLSSSYSRVIGYDEGAQGIVGVEDAGRDGDASLAAIATTIESGMFDFSKRFDSLQDQAISAIDPLDMAMPLLEFIADREWMKNSQLKQIKSFDPWTSSRKRSAR